MFLKIKPNFMQYKILFFPMLVLSACGPVNDSNDANKPVAIPHDEMLKNYGNNAVACYSPTEIGDNISCRTISRYAHHTMSFMEFGELDGKPVKVVYKLRYDDVDGYSCIDHTSADPEKMTIYNASDDIGDVAVEIELRDSPSLLALKDKYVAREKPIGQLCYKYTLFTTDNPKMNYQIKSDEYKDAKPTGKSEMMAIFSNGTKLRVVK